MAIYDLQEQEQLDGLKTWWKMNGVLITGLLVIVAVATAGWQGWNWWQRSQAAQASVLFGNMQNALAQQDAKGVRALAGELIEKYSGTSYAGLAALISAKAQTEGGDVKSAQAQLAWVVDNAKDESVRDLARLRLAVLLADEKAYDQALQHLAVEPAAAFIPRFSELRGDILATQGKVDEARTAYQAALDKLDNMLKEGHAETGMRTGYQQVLQTKLDVLGRSSR
jgi:predicted negative regulator of RcsB-dependent stress response